MKRSLALLASTLLLTVPLAACGDKGDDTSATTTTATGSGSGSSTTAAGGSSTTAAGGSSTSTPATGSSVEIYLVRDEKVAATRRTVGGEGVAKAALEAVIAGPNPVESGIGMASAVPNGTEVLGLDIADGVATVDLSGAFASGGGSLSMQLRVAQVVFTLTQFDTVDTVDIHLDGEPVDGIGGEGVPATDLDRADVADVTPFILVTSPAPGATVSAPFEVRGTANTFEANVQWSVTAADGSLLGSGFTTATAGNGTWGDYSLTAELPGNPTGAATLRVFETDMESGADRNVVEVPITLR